MRGAPSDSRRRTRPWVILRALVSLPPLPDLPINEALPALAQALESRRSVLLDAPPGAGKSTIVPLFLRARPWLEGQKILMLEPRRIAARAVAGRMAHLLGEPVGHSVGFRTRLERRLGARAVHRESAEPARGIAPGGDVGHPGSAAHRQAARRRTDRCR